MKFSKSFLIKAEVITPVFIGTGEEIKPLSYVPDKNKLYVIDTDKFLGSLNEKEQNLYLQWIEPIIDKLSNIAQRISDAKRDKNQSLLKDLRRQRREAESTLTLERFFRDILKVAPLSFLHDRNCIAYTINCALYPSSQGFRPFIKNTIYQPYIPGTELKGAVRNAFAFTAIEDDWQRYKPLFSNVKFTVKKKNKKEIEQEYKNIARKIDKDFLRGKKNDPKYDFFKLLHFEDSCPLSIQQLSIQPIKVLGSRRDIRFFLETLMPDTSFYFTLRIPDLLHPSVKREMEELGLQQFKDKLSIDAILSYIFTRSAKILKTESEYFEDYPQIKNIINGLITKNDRQAPLLRLGAGQGFLGVTLNLQIRDKDESLYDESIREGISFLRRWRTQPHNFPKTRRVIIDRNGNPITILGWLKLSEIEEKKE